jgi:hypothetical protein
MPHPDLSPDSTSSLATATSGPVSLTDEYHGWGGYSTYLMLNYCDENVRDFSMSSIQSTSFEIFYQDVTGLRTKQTPLYNNVCFFDFQRICLRHC